MAYETGTPTSLADLATKMDTFLVAEGWTQDQLDTGAGKAAWHKTTVYVQLRWQVGINTTLGVYHSLGFIGTGTDPGNHTDDSGNGAISGTAATIEGERCLNALGAGPYTAYHFFADSNHFYCVLEYAASKFRHGPCFGTLEGGKFGDNWTGGEWAAGHFHTADSVNVANTCLADGLFSDTASAAEQRAATLHMEGLPNQPVGSKWGQVWGATVATARPDDRGSDPKMMVAGGFRGGPLVRDFAWVPSTSQTGYVSLVPIAMFYIDDVPAVDEWYHLGTLPNVAMMNMRNFADGDEFTIGSDTWKVFATVQNVDGTGDEESQNQGIAYKKVP